MVSTILTRQSETAQLDFPYVRITVGLHPRPDEERVICAGLDAGNSTRDTADILLNLFQYLRALTKLRRKHARMGPNIQGTGINGNTDVAFDQNHSAFLPVV